MNSEVEAIGIDFERCQYRQKQAVLNRFNMLKSNPIFEAVAVRKISV
jgi:hypothetical protein